MQMPLLAVPHLLQAEPAWCLPACVCMVTAYWEQPLTQEDVARWLGTRDIGTPASQVSRLEQRGFHVIYREGSLDEIKQWIDHKVPCIVFMQANELPHWDIETMHALVIVGIDDENVSVLEPAVEDAPIEVSIGDLMVAWTPFDYTYAVLRPVSIKLLQIEV